MKVLIVDDDELVRTITEMLIREIGVEVAVHARNGKEALARLKEITPDLIISDWSMPEMDGLELLRICKRDATLKDIPFIMSSGEVLRAKIQEVEEAGVDAYIEKPFSSAVLRSAVEKYRPTKEVYYD